MRPAHAGHEQHGGERGGVHERRADVRLDEHENDRRQPVAERLQRYAGICDRARALGEEAREGEHEQDLAELGGLEGEEADVDPAT